MTNSNFEDLTGFELEYGQVLSLSRRHEKGYHLWNVQCDLCGLVRELSSGNVKRINGKCPSCAQKKLGAPRTIDGKRTPEFIAWCGIRERCGHIKGRNTYEILGLKVWEGWLGPNGYDEFYAHVGPRPTNSHSIYRIENNRGYFPGNVRWATKSEQNSNKSNVHLVTIDGVEKPLAHWCMDYGIYPAAVTSRIVSGWTIEDAITKPFRPKRPDIDSYYLSIALKASKRSTCLRREVGCVITDTNGFCISTGYNSVPSGIEHCTSKPCAGAFEKSGEALHKCMALHAEDVALMKCSDIRQIGTIYVTASPCIFCTRKLLNTSANRVVFLEEYPHPDAKDLWISQGREWIHRQDLMA